MVGGQGSHFGGNSVLGGLDSYGGALSLDSVVTVRIRACDFRRNSVLCSSNNCARVYGGAVGIV
jgi:hypothetical protein